MNKRQNAQVNMFNAVNAVCKDYAAVTDTNPAFISFLTAYRFKLENLTTPALPGITRIKGVAEDKGAGKLHLARKAHIITSMLYAYAAEKGNSTLEVKTQYNITELSRMRDSNLPLACKIIAQLAEENLPDMTTYHLTQSMIDSLKADTKLFIEASSTPRTAITKRKTQNEIIADSIREISSILRKQMNKLMPAFQSVSPEFATDYKYASKIINTGGRKKKAVFTTVKASDTNVNVDDLRVVKVA